MVDGSTPTDRPMTPPPNNFYGSLAAHQSAMIVIVIATGYAVRHWGVKVNYTRKINHFALMITPFLLAPVLPYRADAMTAFLTLVSFLATTSMFAAPIRRRFPLADLAFAGVDRPEDRPYSLRWTLTQAVASFAMLIVVFWGLEYVGHPELVAIPLLVTGIGDGLAEPVGVRFGRHRYRVPSLARNRRYTRSLEGSAVVFIVAVIVCVAASAELSPLRAVALVTAAPIALTLAEAISPHTWDAPLMYAVGGGVAIAVAV